MKDIKGYENLYAITEDGRVYSYRSQRFLKNWLDKDGYHLITLCKEAKVKYKVHRLVAEAYIPNPENLPLVLHGEKGRDINTLDNLSWGCYSRNLTEAHKRGERRSRVGIPRDAKSDDYY